VFGEMPFLHCDSVHHVTTMNIQSPVGKILEEIHSSLKENFEGALPDYIPELAKADPAHFGITLATVDGKVYEVGDTRRLFTIQSISKPFVYGLGLEDNSRADMLAKVGVEPSGEAFNSISLHPETGRPMNPMINAGAIASTGMIQGVSRERRFERIREMFENYAGRALTVDEEVYRSESETGHRNRAIGHMLRNFGILSGDPEPVLDLYFRQCSIAVDCRDLGVMAATLANAGLNPVTGRRAIRGEYVESVLSVMGSCGMYDYAGEWIYRVGMPAKSGVAGGIIAVLPGQLGIGVFSPLLDSHGNSARGIAACNALSVHFNLHLFNVLHSVRSVIRLKYDGAQVGSNRQRSHSAAALLRELGHRILVYELQGDLVFSTAEVVVRNIAEHLDGVNFVILDLKRVPSLDQSAFKLFAALADSLRDAGRTLVFAHAGGRLRTFVRNRADKSRAPGWLEFADTNAALAHCEDQLHGVMEIAEVAFEALDVLEDFTTAELEILRGCTSERRHAQGDVIVEAGAEANEVFFLTAGRVSVRLMLENGETKEVGAYLPGVVFGEMAFIDGSKRSASVVADSAVVCHALTRGDFERIGLEHPGMQVKLLRNLLRVFSANLRKADREIAILAQ
jgi:glutaminase